MAQAWLVDGRDWPVRRVVTVTAQNTPNAPGPEVAVVDLPTDTRLADDGRDLRVATSAGRPIPFRILQIGPGSSVRVAFEAQPGRKEYGIYYGHPKADPPGEELALDIRRGLLLETRTFAGGNIQSEKGVRNAFKRADIAQGGNFVPNVFLGHNPFGPTGRTVSVYRGLLRVPMDGEYGFATTSDDASFLTIDGKLVVGWGGRHGWVGDARHNETVKLTGGLHAFEYWHVNMGVRGGAVAAWKPPGAQRWLPIPPTAFLPVFRGELGARERFGTPRAAEMQWRQMGEALLDSEDYIQRIRFSCSPSGFDPKRSTFTWDLGDGNTLRGQGLHQIEHVYLLDGPVTVRVTVENQQFRDHVSNQVVVARDWDRVTQKRIDKPADHANIVARYAFAAMDPQVLARAMELFKRTERPRDYMRAGHALAAEATPVRDKVLTETMPQYAAFLIERDASNGPAAAASEYIAAAGRATSPFARAAMYTGAGRVLLDYLDNDPKAEQMFAAALKFADRGNDPAIRAAWVGAGDVHRRRGDGAKALAAYEKAASMGREMPANQQAVRVGSLSRSIEYYIREKNLEEAETMLREWDLEFPTHKLNGYSTLLWVRFYQAGGQHERAVREAGDLVAAAPRSNYAPQLLLLAADSRVALDQPAKARALLDHLLSVYPTSPLTADAKKKLSDLPTP